MFLNPLKRNLSTTFLPLLQFSLVEYTDLESTKLKSRKIQIYPTTEQKSLLRQWMGTARYTFNKTVEYLKQKGTKADWLKIKTPAIHSLPEWAKAVPYQIKSIAVKEACTAVKNAKKKFKQTGRIQEVKFRSRRERKDSIFIPKSAMREESFYCTYLGGKIQPAEVIPVIKHDCHAVCEWGV